MIYEVILNGSVVSAVGCLKAAKEKQKEIFGASYVGDDVRVVDGKNKIHAHGKRIYADDSPVWDAPCDDEDARRVLAAIICRAALDEKKKHSLLKSEKMWHDYYLESHLGLSYDCELLDMCEKRVLQAIRRGTFADE